MTKKNTHRPVLMRWFGTPRHILLAVVAVVAIGGTLLTLFSKAENLDVSPDPNTVVIQYSLPHQALPVSTTNLTPAMVSPYTLYGNGLLVCGHSSMGHMSATDMLKDVSMTSAPTSTMLTHDEMVTTLKQIADTGFMSLQKEYYKLPIDANQEIVRVSLLSGDKYVMYYRDVAAPQAYTDTVAILKKQCETVTAPYVAASATIRSIADPDVSANPVKQVSDLPAPASAALQGVLPLAAQTHANWSQRSARGASQIASPEAKLTVSGQQAADAQHGFAGKDRSFINQGGRTYEIAVDPILPEISNKLNVDYTKVRTEATNKGLAAKLKHLGYPSAYADGTRPIRVVLLLAADGGSTDTLAQAQSLGQQVHDWYCYQVGACYAYQGVSVMRGTQTMSYYTTCHQSSGYCLTGSGASEPLTSLLYNVFTSDNGTIYRSDVDTLIVTGWAMNSIQNGVCGIGFVNATLSAIDYYAPTKFTSSSTYCQLGQGSAHELGHNFGLVHTGNGTLMDGPPYSQYASNCDIGDSTTPTCVLDGAQAQAIRNGGTYFPPQQHPLQATITAPTNGATVSGTVQINVQLTDDYATPTSSDIIVDGKIIGNLQYPGTSYFWDSKTVPNGTHYLHIKSFSTSGESVEGNQVTVTVDNSATTKTGGSALYYPPLPPPPPGPTPSDDKTPPTVAITAPANGALVGTKGVTIKAIASDDVGVTKMEIYADGVLKQTVSTNSLSYVYTTKTKGTHTIAVAAYDAAGNHTSTSITVKK